MTILNQFSIHNKKQNHHFALFPFLVTVYLILMFLFPISSLSGAKSGLLLWFNVILPTLLPFIIVSNLIVTLNITKTICFLFQPILTRLFGISKAGCYPIVIGMLSGIPVGAKTCADMMNQGTLTDEEGQYLAALCNNASYMFITSYIAVTNLNLPEYRYQILGILYLSILICSILYQVIRFQKKISHKTKLLATSVSLEKSIVSNDKGKENKPIRLDFKIVDEAIMNGFEVITKIGGYIILFSILVKIITDVFPKNIITYLIVGFLEITTGIDCISNSSLHYNIKIILILSITAFGGLSSIAQTKSVIMNSRLSLKTYVKWKLFIMSVTTLITFIYVMFIK